MENHSISLSIYHAHPTAIAPSSVKIMVAVKNFDSFTMYLFWGVPGLFYILEL